MRWSTYSGFNGFPGEGTRANATVHITPCSSNMAPDAPGMLNQRGAQHPDCLARFGYEYPTQLFGVLGVSLAVVDAESSEGCDADNELVNDLLAVVLSFAAGTALRCEERTQVATRGHSGAG